MPNPLIPPASLKSKLNLTCKLSPLPEISILLAGIDVQSFIKLAGLFEPVSYSVLKTQPFLSPKLVILLLKSKNNTPYSLYLPVLDKVFDISPGAGITETFTERFDSLLSLIPYLFLITESGFVYDNVAIEDPYNSLFKIKIILLAHFPFL